MPLSNSLQVRPRSASPSPLPGTIASAAGGSETTGPLGTSHGRSTVSALAAFDRPTRAFVREALAVPLGRREVPGAPGGGASGLLDL